MSDIEIFHKKRSVPKCGFEKQRYGSFIRKAEDPRRYYPVCVADFPVTDLESAKDLLGSFATVPHYSGWKDNEGQFCFMDIYLKDECGLSRLLGKKNMWKVIITPREFTVETTYMGPERKVYTFSMKELYEQLKPDNSKIQSSTK